MHTGNVSFGQIRQNLSSLAIEILPMFGSKKGQVLIPKNTISRNMEVFGTRNLVRVEGIMKMEDHEKILKDRLRQSATKDGLGWWLVFQHDNVPKHTSLLVKNYLQKSKVNVLDWPAQSPDSNPI